MALRKIFGMTILAIWISCASPYVDVKQKFDEEKQIVLPADIPNSWIKRKISISKVERDNLIYSLQEPKIGVPFKTRSQEWSDFKSKLCNECTLWIWESPRYGSPEIYEWYHGFLIKHGESVVAVFKNGWTISYLDL